MNLAAPDAAPTLTDDDLLGFIALSPEPKRILEDYTPLWRSLDLRLARAFWKERGVSAFLEGEVPYGATSSGRLADDYARILLAHWSETEASGPFRLLEIGAGSGVFAKILLDRLAVHSPATYLATRFVITDGSEAMLDDMRKLDIFEAHGDRLALIRVDATRPLADQLATAGEAPDNYHGVFANYLLDSLPFSIRAFRGTDAWEMEARAGLDDAVELDRYFDGDVDELRAAIEKLNDAPDPRLAQIFKALVLDARFVPSPRVDAPFAETLPPSEDDTLTRVNLDNYGAVSLLDQLATALAPNGVLLFTDYGRSDEPEQGEALEYQRFGGSVAAGLNFAQVDRWAEARDGVWLFKPTIDPDSLMTRAVTKSSNKATGALIDELCSADRLDALAAPLTSARDLVKGKHFEAARWRYEEALRLQPCNWNALEEVATFLITVAGDVNAGLAVVMRALELNPASPNAHRLMGRALWGNGERAMAESAYRRALKLGPNDCALRIDLAEALLARFAHRDALLVVAEGLAIDETSEYREDLIATQEKILQDLSLQARDDLIRSANRMRRHRALPGDPAGDAGEE